MARVRHDEHFWRERLEKWASSGLSARDFAAREGLRPERLFFWKRRLRSSAAIAVAGVSFAKVSVQPASADVTGEPLDVVMRTGHVIRVRPRFDESTLRRLLSILGGA